MNFLNSILKCMQNIIKINIKLKMTLYEYYNQHTKIQYVHLNKDKQK